MKPDLEAIRKRLEAAATKHFLPGSEHCPGMDQMAAMQEYEAKRSFEANAWSDIAALLKYVDALETRIVSLEALR